MADIRIVEEHASFGVTCRRWNLGLGDGGTQRLPRIVGMGRAMEMIITGRVINAEEAYRIGLANEIVPKGKSLERAVELANFICTLPQPAIRSDKEAGRAGLRNAAARRAAYRGGMLEQICLRPGDLGRFPEFLSSVTIPTGVTTRSQKHRASSDKNSPGVEGSARGQTKKKWRD